MKKTDANSSCSEIKKPKVLFYDSGLGGLTVLAALIKHYPAADYTYVADNACFPVGDMAAEALLARVVSVIETALQTSAYDMCVIACNTASTLVLPSLRVRFDLPFVGTVPAIKPASALSQSRIISVLATPATVKRDYTHDLIAKFAPDCQVKLVGAPLLASLAEARMKGIKPDDEALRGEIAATFVDDGKARTDVVVLGCTHFPLVLDDLIRLAPWPVTWLDPAPAIARHAASLLPTSLETVKTEDKMPTQVLLRATAPMAWPDMDAVLMSLSNSETIDVHCGDNLVLPTNTAR